MSNASQSLARTAPPALIAVAGLTVLGFVLRAAQFDQSLFGDELSTYWILHDHSLGEVLDSVRSNDEITPPLYFVLGWLSLELGPDPAWVRLPSLLAGTAAIPLVYLLGVRTLGRGAGLVGAAVMTLSPFMIYYSAEARSYALMIALVTASTVALLAAIDSRRARWWVVYAVCSCGALLSHYTSAFPLAAQFAWTLWAHREAIRSLLLANLGVVAGFAPWIPGFIDDNSSPTTEILSALQPFELDAVRFALEAWAVGYPYVRLETVPGHVGGVLIAVGLLAAATAGAVRLWRSWRRSRPGVRAAMRRIPARLVLVASLALAAPLGEAIYSALGTNLLGARNLNASTPGLALAIGAVVSSAGSLLAVGCAALVLAGFAIGAARTFDSDVARIDYAAAAGVIERRWGPGDVVVDAAPLTPVPLTGLDVYLPQSNPEFRLGLPLSEHPFMVGDPVPPPGRLIAQAYETGEGRSIFLVRQLPSSELAGSTSRVVALRRERQGLGARLLRRAPPGFEVTYRRTLPGLAPLAVLEIEDHGGGR
jgi:Dolichyl-phosphate-mannose-protein mannosyltransferase